MRLIPVLLIAAVASTPSLAQSRAARPKPASHPASPAPHAIGKYEDWTAATHQESGQTVCYAFTRAVSSAPPLQGRGDVVLTVTQRPGSARDAVAISAGYAFAPNAEVSVQVEGTALPFYTSQRSAFARDGHATVTAMERGRQAVAKGPGPRNAVIVDTFNLRGFAPAYAAINKACSGKG